ncbi:MAG: hypothetical protein VX988_06630 [Planctomycetota bacterium]|nr:hypothetical protein [Planctomycetota bacterium]MEE3220727.1 hypothetical protein [Planctomycetota bacterium]
MPRCYHRRALLFGLAASFGLAGCRQGASPKMNDQALAELRSRYILSAEPEGVEGVLDVQEGYEKPREVVMVGRIGGIKNPWTAGKAAFVMADPVVMADAAAAEADEHECEDAGCKFCQSKKLDKMNEGLAVVRFVDERGDLVNIDARQLFEVKEQETVVVCGRAEVDGLGCLVVLADGLYVRR